MLATFFEEEIKIKKIISIVVVLALLITTAIPGAAASESKASNTPIYTQTADYNGQSYTFEMYADGSSVVYTEYDGEYTVLSLESDGTATADVEAGGQHDSFALDIEDLNHEDIDFDVYKYNNTDEAQTYGVDGANNADLVVSISSVEELEEVVEGGKQGRASVVTVSVLSLLTLIFVTITLLYSTRYIKGERYDYLSVVVEAIREMEESVKIYYAAIALHEEHDVLVFFVNPFDLKEAKIRLREGKSVYTFFSANALSAVREAASGSPYTYNGEVDINQNRMDGFIYYYHYHLLEADKKTHHAHAWFGFPYTK